MRYMRPPPGCQFAKGQTDKEEGEIYACPNRCISDVLSVALTESSAEACLRWDPSCQLPEQGTHVFTGLLVNRSAIRRREVGRSGYPSSLPGIPALCFSRLCMF